MADLEAIVDELETENAHLQDEVDELAERVKKLERTLESVRMTIELLRMGGSSEPSKQFDRDLKRMALEEIAETLGAGRE